MSSYILTIDTLIEDFGHFFERHGVNEEDIRKGYMPNMDILQYAYNLLNSLYEPINWAYWDNEISDKEYFWKQGEIEKEMFLLLRLSNHPQTLIFQRDYLHNELEAYNCAKVKFVKIIISGRPCSTHLHYDDKIVSWQEAWDFVSAIPTTNDHTATCNISIYKP